MMNDMYSLLLTALAVLFASAIISGALSGRRRLAGWINFLLVAASAGILWYVSYEAVFGGVEAHSRLIDLYVVKLHFLIDGFSALFMTLISLVAVMTAFYSIRYMEHYRDYSLRVYYVSFPLFILGMIALVTVDDLSIGFTIAWQLMTITSYLLVRFEHRKKENRFGANKYLALMELAWVMIVAVSFLISGAGLGDSIHELSGKMSGLSPFMLYAVLGLLLVGFGFKAGMFPFGQLWLPDAHSVAPSPVSALLSGVMLKTGIYGIVRTFFWMAPSSTAFDGYTWGMVIASFGVATLFIGTVQSVKQSDGKRLLAYSSIGQLGYIIFALGSALMLFNTGITAVKALAVVALVGALFHVMNHAIFKGLLFLSSGSVLYATGIKDLNKLGGLMKLMPLSALLAGIASLSIAGIPPLSGFASKWTIIATSLIAGNGFIFLVVFGVIALFTSTITLACYVKYFGMTYASSGIEWNTDREITEVPGSMLLPKVIMAFISLAQGLFPFLSYAIITRVMQQSPGAVITSAFGSSSVNALVDTSALGVVIQSGEGAAMATFSPVAILLVFAIAVSIGAFLKGSGGAQRRETRPWLGGYQELHNTNRFADRNMFAAFKRFFGWAGGNVRDR